MTLALLDLSLQNWSSAINTPITRQIGKSLQKLRRNLFYLGNC